jgi:hypothetical protein
MGEGEPDGVLSDAGKAATWGSFPDVCTGTSLSKMLRELEERRLFDMGVYNRREWCQM